MPTYDPEETLDRDCTPPAKVFLDGQRVPIINDGVVLEWRKDGPLSMQFTADVYVPQEGPQGNDWTPVYNDTVFNVVDIQVRDYATNTYPRVARGVLTGVGGGQATRNELRLRVVDPALILNKLPIPKGVQFSKSTTLQTALTKVGDAFAQQNPTFDDVTLGRPQSLSVDAQSNDNLDPQSDAGSEADFVYQNIVNTTLDVLPGISTNPSEGDSPDESADEVTLNKNFDVYTDTLADVLSYITDIQGLYTYFNSNIGDRGQPRTALVVSSGEPNEATFTTRDNDGGLILLENNMLAEINPINTLKVYGGKQTVPADFEGEDTQTGGVAETAASSGLVQVYDTAEEWFSPEANERTVQRPLVTVEHEPTKEIAGQRVVDQTELKEENELATLENQAKNELKQRLDGAGFGNAKTLLAPYVRPYNVLNLPYNCGEPYFEYEVERLTHHAGPTVQGEEGTHAKTEFQCSLATRKSEMNVVTSEIKATSGKPGVIVDIFD